MQISKIWVDMDGVLCDFEKRYTELYGELSEQVRRTSFRPNFDDFIKTEQFASLDIMKDAHILIEYLNSLDIPKEILSSTAYDEVYDTISKQKQSWLADHNIRWTANFVPGKRHKYKFATPNSIIIDDTFSIIEDWNKAGGIAIHHKDAISTINVLQMYV